MSDPALGGFFEFPVINEAFRGRRYRFTYGLTAKRPTNVGNQLAKVCIQPPQPSYPSGMGPLSDPETPWPGGYGDWAGVDLPPGWGLAGGTLLCCPAGSYRGRRWGTHQPPRRRVQRAAARDPDPELIWSPLWFSTGANGNSLVVILDARSFSELARAEVPLALTGGFHGAFFKS